MLKIELNDIGTFEDGFFRVQSGNKIGILNDSGQEVVACKYDMIYPIISGYAIVK